MTTNFELEELAKKLKIRNFKGCFMKDQLIDLRPQLHEYLIVNLQNSDQSGSHWAAVIRDEEEKYYYSSFGDDPPLEVQHYLGKKIISSTFQTQQAEESCCGQLAMLVIYLYDNGVSFEDSVLLLVGR